MRPTIKLTTHFDQRPTFVNVEGDIDTSTAKELRHQLLVAIMEDTDLLLVRLKLVPYMDSAGVAVLLELIKKARERDKRIAVLEPSEAARRAMAIVDLDALIKVYTSVEECAACTMLTSDVIRENIFTERELAAASGGTNGKGVA